MFDIITFASFDGTDVARKGKTNSIERNNKTGQLLHLTH